MKKFPPLGAVPLLAAGLASCRSETRRQRQSFLTFTGGRFSALNDRNRRSVSLRSSTRRIFSGQLSRARPFCHSAWRSHNDRFSIIEEPPLKATVFLGESVAVRQGFDLLPRYGTRLEQRQDAGEVFRSPDAQGNHGQVIGSNHSQRDSLEIDGLRLFQSFSGQIIEGRDELNRPGPDLYCFTFRCTAAITAESVYWSQGIEAFRRRKSHKNIRIQGGNRLGVSHLRCSAEKSIIDDHTLATHCVEQFGHISHDGSLARMMKAPNRKEPYPRTPDGSEKDG